MSRVSAVMSWTTSISSSALRRSHFLTSCSAMSTMLGWYDCMARLPNGCIRMLCALLQFGSLVSAVNRPSPPTARTRRSEPRTALSKRFSSESSSTRSWPDTITSGAPIMSSQKIGPSSLESLTRCCTGAVESSDSMLPTTGFVGGCGIGLSLLPDAIFEVPPVLYSSLRGAKRRSNPSVLICGPMDCFASLAMTALVSRRHPNRFLRHSISLALTSSGFSCCVQWPLSLTRYFSRSGTSRSMPSAAEGGSTASFSAMIISDGTRT
ncbi:hypothetical protein ABIF31_009003 [Bradyrhizobium elkanii]